MSAVASDEMEVLAPASASVSYGDEVIAVQPMAIGVIPLVVRELRPVINAVRSGSGDVGALELEINAGLIMDLVVDHADALFTAVALCVGRPREEIVAGNPAEFVELTLKIVEVNRDFFTQRIAPLLGGLRNLFRGPGPIASSS